MIRSLRARLRSDDGFTLVELLVVGLLTVVVLGTVGGIYIATMGVQRTVGAMNQVTTDGQLAARDIDNGVRNGTAFEITTLLSGDQLLRTRTIDASADGVWNCRAWYYSASEGSIRRTVASETTEIEVPTAAELAGWTLLVTGIRPTESTVFAIDDTFETVLAVDFITVGVDDADASRIKFSTPLMPVPIEEGSCF